MFSESAGPEVDAFFGKGRGNKIGVIFYGSEGYLVQTSYNYCQAFDKEKNSIKEFRAKNVGDDHFANFLDSVQSRDMSALNAGCKVRAPVSCGCSLGEHFLLLG